MDDFPKTPLVFANKVIQQLIDHVVGDDYIVTNGDYLTIRIAFRNGGGRWLKVALGDIIHSRLLTNIVVAWGKMPCRQKKPF
jgi:hypothetical protein